jgi:serine/threonine protein kinase
MKREAEVLLEIRHPNVVQCFELGALPSGLPFLVLELVQGPTLLDLVQKMGPLAPARASAIAVQIARGLSALHERGVVHRDLKLSNLMLENDQVKISDLGIILLEATDATRLTMTARPLGTRSYMAPEQLRDPRSVTRAADLYALGVILNALVTGRLPDGDSIASNAPLGRAIALLLEPDPTKRLTAPALIELLGRAHASPRRRWPRLLALSTAPLALSAAVWAYRASKPATAVVQPPPPPIEAPVEAPVAIGRRVRIEEKARTEAPPEIETPRRTRARPTRTGAPPRPHEVEAPLPPPPPPAAPAPARIDRDEIAGRLARSVERLRTVAPALPKEELKVLESGYFSVRRSLAGAETDDDLAQVARAAHDFDRDVGRMLERFGTVEP